MGKMQRNKGKSGEREVVAIFDGIHKAIGFCKSDSNGAEVPVGRNHSQAERGGHDITGVAFFAPEVKRVATPPSRGQVKKWWAQTCEQADIACKEPLLLYRANHQPWTIVLWAQVEGMPQEWYMMEMGSEEFMCYYRDRVYNGMCDG